MSLPKIIGIIPARYGSTRFPGKPLVPILGKTLLQRTYENASRISSICRLIVATDDRRIFDHVKQLGGEVIMTSEQCLTGTERLAEVIENDASLLASDLIVNIQGDEPCIDPQMIEKLCSLLLEDPSAVMATIATPLRMELEFRNSSVVKCVVDQQGNALYFSRASIPASKELTFNAQASYLRHIGVYAYRPSFLLIYPKLSSTPLQQVEDLEQLKVVEHGYKIKVMITEHQMGVSIDTPEDVHQLEQWICKQNISLLQEESAPRLAKG